MGGGGFFSIFKLVPPPPVRFPLSSNLDPPEHPAISGSALDIHQFALRTWSICGSSSLFVSAHNVNHLRGSDVANATFQQPSLARELPTRDIDHIGQNMPPAS